MMISRESNFKQAGLRVCKRHLWFLLFIGLVSYNSLVARAQATGEGLTPSRQYSEIEVPIIDKVNTRNPGFSYCGHRGDALGAVVEEATFRRLTADGSETVPPSRSLRCAFLNRLKVDFGRHTLLTYGVNGDCFIRATAAVARNDNARKYVLRITKLYGGCRAAGSFEEWLVIEKIPPDYEVEVELFARDESGATRRVDRR